MIQVIALWALFAATHVGLSTAAVRGRLVSWLGERGFLAVYSVVASVGFAALVAGYADVRTEGPPGLGLAAVPFARGPLVALIGAGIMLMAGAFAPNGYWDSPAVPLSRRVRGPVGLERITRHPFFAGTVLVFGAHALLATHLTGAVFSAGFVVLAVLGPIHQARKLRVSKGAVAWDRYVAETSAVPFLAVLAGRQHVVWDELPWGTFAIGLLAAIGIRAVHGQLFAVHGAPVSIAVVGGSVLIGVVAAVRARQSAARP